MTRHRFMHPELAMPEGPDRDRLVALRSLATCIVIRATVGQVPRGRLRAGHLGSCRSETYRRRPRSRRSPAHLKGAAMAHLLSIAFFFGLLVALAVILELVVRPNWATIVAALRGRPPRG